jgi:micrococcal nuclease
LLAAVLAGCGDGDGSSGAGLRSEPDEELRGGPADAGVPQGHGVEDARRRRGRRARVEAVSDGDTITLSGLGKVRLIGVDTPELSEGQCFGREAAAFTRRVLARGTRVEYRLGRERRDRYGRALAYVWLADGRFFNDVLVRQGYAYPLEIAPNTEYATAFRRAARVAERRGRGLWGPPCNGETGRRKPCSEFASQREAQAYFDGPGREERASHDGDGDGRVCETLP